MIERPKIKDTAILAYVESLEKQLEFFVKSPFCESYLALKSMVDKGNKHIMETESNFFKEDNEKEFKMMTTFLSCQKEYADNMEYFKKKMNPKEEAEVDKKVKEKIVKEGGVEEYLKTLKP